MTWLRASLLFLVLQSYFGKAVVLAEEEPAPNLELGHFEKLPFSFVYGGRPSAELLPSWGRQEKVESTPEGRERRIITFTDRTTKLELRAEITRCDDFPAIDWVLRFTNRGQADSRLLEDVLPLNLSVKIPNGDIVFHYAHGSTASATDYLPIDEPLAPGSVVNLAPTGGPSSQEVLPFFNMAWPQGGLVWAVGWSGQWSQQVQRIGAATIGIKAGQQLLRVKLHPGESIRTPRILLLSWRGTDSVRGDNQLRRLLLAHYVPRRGGEIVMPPVTQNSWWIDDFGNGTTEENQLKHFRALPALGVEGWWLDAGWFEGGWPHGAGNWVPNAEHFPHGLRPLSDEAHRLGLKFIVWFEPERVDPHSLIAKEHPEFVLGLHPNLVFDDCASGGRRIDLEMISRSFILSRSDSVGRTDATAAWDQAQTAGLSRFVPLNATISTCGLPKYQELSLYSLRSAATSGFGICQESFAKDFQTDLFKKVIAEVKMLRPLYLGDFYPLTSINVNSEVWCAWQFDRPEMGRGFAMFFRRPQSPNPDIEVSMRGLDPRAEYEVTFVDSSETRRLTGANLAKLRVEIANAPGSALVTYRKLERQDER